MFAPTATVKPPLCKGRWMREAQTEGLWPYGGRSIFWQGHDPPPPTGGALRARAPLSLRDISPHCGESPFTQGGLWVRVSACVRSPGRILYPPVGLCGGARFLRANNVRPYSPQALGCRGRRPRRPDDYAYVAGGYGIRPYGIHESRGIRRAPASGARAAKTAVG